MVVCIVRQHKSGLRGTISALRCAYLYNVGTYLTRFSRLGGCRLLGIAHLASSHLQVRHVKLDQTILEACCMAPNSDGISRLASNPAMLCTCLKLQSSSVEPWMVVRTVPRLPGCQPLFPSSAGLLPCPSIFGAHLDFVASIQNLEVSMPRPSPRAIRTGRVEVTPADGLRSVDNGDGFAGIRRPLCRVPSKRTRLDGGDCPRLEIAIS